MKAIAILLIVICATACPSQEQQRESNADRGKTLAERPMEALVQTRATAAATIGGVESNLVKWHQDLATAEATSKRSSKPVLRFQLMGRLDERFT
jgi:hypothetical protein